MQLDGEWRLGMAKDAGVDFEIGTAPLPVARRPGGPATARGTCPAPSWASPPPAQSKNAAWELVKYMTTDTEAVVAFANAIHNVPSTLPRPSSPPNWTDPAFKTFLDIAAAPQKSNTPPCLASTAAHVPADPPGLRLRTTSRGKVKDLTGRL